MAYHPPASPPDDTALSASAETTSTAIAKISAAKRALSSARDLTEALEIRDVAAAAHAWAAARGADEAAALAQEVKLSAERLAGWFLKDMKEKGELKPGRPMGDNGDIVSLFSTLKEFGIEKQEFSRGEKVRAGRAGGEGHPKKEPKSSSAAYTVQAAEPKSSYSGPLGPVVRLPGPGQPSSREPGPAADGQVDQRAPQEPD